ncbi:hypothetical protein MSMTP_0183 [Methanosarcina sp. MTP4]|uniref:hypothetical protein n=1 Tax=Methanosarcina sp. MTP4 TaxID=1434100 RepID=UPI0006155EF3|nr:hypothetical protein [Methanosarcina sp. MTP4]AKB23652.1 hypothetical protein MSMTP_0183 [Methanosarcina sp. MTP4]
MDKRDRAYLIAASAALAVLILGILIYSYFKAQFLWGIIVAGMIILIAFSLLFCLVFTDSLAFPWKSEGGKFGVSGVKSEGIKSGEVESEGVESEALSDSKVYERPSFFFGIPFGFVLGGVFSRYESLFSMEYDGGSAAVLYRGVCLVSKGDRLRITGKWYPGKKIGVRGNVIVADRVENLSSGLIFSKE